MVPCSLWQRTVTRGSAAAGDTRVNPGTPLELARRALRAAPEDPEVLAADAYVLGIRGEDIAVAILTASALLKFPVSLMLPTKRYQKISPAICRSRWGMFSD